MLCIIIHAQYDIKSTYFYVSKMYSVLRNYMIWCWVPKFCEEQNATVGYKTPI
jgi:hypothetical protein